jgi:hypothetical protein
MFPIIAAGAVDDGAALPAFVVARDGLFLRKRSLLGTSQTRTGRIAHLPAGTEFLDYALPPVPADVMGRAVGFFRAVHRLQRTEAACLLLWRDGVFDLLVPAQKATGASVQFDVAPGDIAPGARVVGSMHSHGVFGAYASTTDEDDDAELDGLHLVVGDFDQCRPGFAAAVVVDGVRFKLPDERLFVRPRRLIEPPRDWLERVVKAPAMPKPAPAKARLGGWKPRLLAPAAPATREDLDAMLADAVQLAASMGLHLAVWLTPEEEWGA